jgi:hypothetical protein
MADPTITLKTKRITELLTSDPLVGDELMPIYQAGVTKKLSVLDIGDYMKLQDYSTWVYSNSAIEKQTSDWVSNNQTNILTQVNWVQNNYIREQAATDLVNLSAANWKTAYDFSKQVISGDNSQLKLGANCITTLNLTDGNVTPSKLSTGGPSWDTTSFYIPSSSIKFNTNNADSYFYINNNSYNKNSNLIHTGSGDFYITSESSLGDIIIQTLNNANISLKTASTERVTIDGPTGAVTFGGNITAPKGTFTTLSASNIDISSIIQSSLKISNLGTIQFLNSNNQQRFYIGSPTSDKFNIYNNVTNSTSIFIDDSNRVGIATNTPSYNLDVNGTARAYGLVSTNNTTPSAIDAKVKLIKTDASADQKTWELVNDGSGSFLIRTINDAGTQSNNAISIYRKSTTHGIDKITFGTSLGPVINIIDTDGKVGIGTSTPSYKLHVTSTIKTDLDLITDGDLYFKNNKTIKFYNANGTTVSNILNLDSNNALNIQGNVIYFKTLAGTNLGNFDGSGNLTATGDIAAFSDEKLKKNVKTIQNALEKVKSLRGVEYERVDIEQKGIGFIAQELEKIIPNVVNTQGDYKTVSYGNITSILVEAIKELSKEVEYLKNKLS